MRRFPELVGRLLGGGAGAASHSGDDMLLLRDSRVWLTKFEHDPDSECGDRARRTSMTLSLRFRALDPNADQDAIKQANSIATPEEAFSLRQLLITAANPRRSSPTLDTSPTNDGGNETAPECRQPTAATVR